MQDRMTDVTAAGALTSPFWLQWLHDATSNMSDFAALWLPILGVLWLGVQIWAKIVTTVEEMDHKRKPKDNSDD